MRGAVLGYLNDWYGFGKRAATVARVLEIDRAIVDRALIELEREGNVKRHHGLWMVHG